MPRCTHPPLKSYGLKRACIGPRASWAASCSSCLGTEAIRRGLKAAAAIVFGASDFAGVVFLFFTSLPKAGLHERQNESCTTFCRRPGDV